MFIRHVYKEYVNFLVQDTINIILVYLAVRTAQSV